MLKLKPVYKSYDCYYSSDYDQPKPVKQYIGSITDRDLVGRACQGVSSVIHVAGLIDVSMFPDLQKLELVNVTGTCKV